MNHLSMQSFDKCAVFRFRVTHNYIIVGNKENIGDFPFRREGFPTAGCTQNQAVGVFEQLPVHHNEVVGQGIQPAIQGFFPVLEKLLRSERYENRRGGCGQPTLDFHLV